jgi:hypothetical protein
MMCCNVPMVPAFLCSGVCILRHASQHSRPRIIKAPSCLQAVINVGPGYWAVVILTGVSTGFDGALSTVSTFVNEVRTHSLTHLASVVAMMRKLVQVHARWPLREKRGCAVLALETCMGQEGPDVRSAHSLG